MKSAGVVTTSPITKHCALPSATGRLTCPGLWPRVSIAVIPGATSAPGRKRSTFSW